MSVGYIYVLSNSAMPGLIKIGFTNRDVKERAQELSAATGVPTLFEVEYHCLTRNVENVEVEVHKRLSKYQQPGKEFFSISLVQAVDIIDSLIQQVESDRFSKVRMRQEGSAPVLYLCPTCGARNLSPSKCIGCGRECIG